MNNNRQVYDYTGLVAKEKLRGFGRRMASRYILATLILLVVLSLDYAVVRRSIRYRELDAAAIDITGRQRMLSQRIALFSLRLAVTAQADERARMRRELSGIVKLMEGTHNQVFHTSELATKPQFKISVALKAIYYSAPAYLDKKLHGYFDNVRALLDEPDSGLNPDNPVLRNILSAAPDLLDGLDAAVKQFVSESEQDIQKIKNTQLGLMIINILTLLSIAAFILRPAMKRIQRDIEILHQANEFNEVLLKAIPFVMDIVDEQGNIIYVNEKFKQVLGSDLVGGKCHELYKDDRKPCGNCPLVKGIELGKVDTLEVEGVLGGRTFRISHVGLVYQGSKALLEIFEDITEKARAEKQLREAISIKSNFISMVSHELRTPLTAIKEGIAIVLDGAAGCTSPEQKEFLDIAKKNVERLSRLINDVLDYQKLDAGKMDFEMSEGDINEVVKDVEKAMATLARNKGLDFTVELGHGLPRPRFDSDKITQVLMNLVNNAIKFTETGFVKVMTFKNEAKDAVAVCVEDTGIGIREEEAGKLFQSFGQLAKGGDRKSGSTGLGLVISERIIHHHGGRIWFESEFGKGSTFCFSLPLKTPKA